MRTLVALALTAALLPAAASPKRVVVSDNHRFLQYEDGSPFFWLGDTAWLLFSKLDREETERFLEDRRRKGFNVLQVMVLNSTSMQSVNGAAALIDRDPGKPLTAANGSSYWDHVEWVIDRAAEKGIYIGMVLAWGSIVKKGELNSGNVGAYAAFLARRYKGKPNIFWLTGGDIPGDPNTDVWKLMGRTLRAEDPGHLITFHPFGRTMSATWFHNEAWLDFNMFQSGHRRYDQDTESGHRYGEDGWRYARDSYLRQPVKPVIDGEPSYENIPQGLHDTTQPYWTAGDCRRYAYWSVFAGACGHTYGDNAIMQFHKPGGGKGSYGPRNYWYEAIADPGAGQMQYLKRLLLSRPYFDRVPDQTLVAGENGTRYDYVIATRGKAYALVYSYSGKPFEIRLGVLTGDELRAYWYDPRNGAATAIGSFPNKGTKQFSPPGAGNDWVLVLDDASKKFTAP